LRVVSGTASTGGSVAFTTAFAASLSAGNTTLSTTQMPSHSHAIDVVSANDGPNYGPPIFSSSNPPGGWGTTTAGSSGSHNHTIPSFAVSYVDVIIATKN